MKEELGEGRREKKRMRELGGVSKEGSREQGGRRPRQSDPSSY